LPAEIAQYNLPDKNGSIYALGDRYSWYRPPTVLNQSEWYINSGSFNTDILQLDFELQLVTGENNRLGSSAWAIGSRITEAQPVGRIDYGSLEITGLTVRPASQISERPTSPIPEP